MTWRQAKNRGVAAAMMLRLESIALQYVYNDDQYFDQGMYNPPLDQS
jgi:hypothetical protein